jgi:hypothetical protein
VTGHNEYNFLLAAYITTSDERITMALCSSVSLLFSNVSIMLYICHVYSLII